MKYRNKKLSELDLHTVALCQHAETTWSTTLEITRLSNSPNGKFTFLKISYGEFGNTKVSHHWRELSDIDSKYTVVDILSVGIGQ
jgi:hypothetical protein